MTGSEEARKEVREMAGNGLGKVADGGVVGAKVASVTAVPRVLSGELTVGEGTRLVARAGVQGAAVTGAAPVVAVAAAVVGAPVVAVVAIGAGVAWAAGRLFDSIFD